MSTTNDDVDGGTDPENRSHPREQVLPHVRVGLAKCGVCGTAVEWGDCSDR
jgi:hypothetical protein